MKKGFTLPETLVVISVLSVLGVLVLTIFSRSLRVTSKTAIIGTIKQNGQAVLENMDKVIRNADNVICVKEDSPLATIVTVSSDAIGNSSSDFYTRYRFVEQSGSNSYIAWDNPTQGTNTLEGFIATVCTDPMSNPNTLTDKDPQTGVSVNLIADSGGKYILRNRSPGNKDSVTVQFALTPGVGIPAAVSSQIDPITFQTTIQLRNTK